MWESQPTPPLLQADVAGPILAWRQWLLVDGVLYSVTQRVPWPKRQPLHAPVSSLAATSNRLSTAYDTAQHGIYAAKDRHRLDYKGVTGRVALWGRVIEHEHGYRAEYAYPYDLVIPKPPMPGFPPTLATQIRAVADAYGIAAVEED